MPANKAENAPAAASAVIREGEPLTLRDVEEFGVYRLAVAGRLLDLHPDTLLRHGAQTLPRPFHNSAHRILGREIFRLAGVREIVRASRTSEGGETQAAREKRANKIKEGLLARLKTKVAK